MSSVVGYANSKGHRHGHPIHARKGRVERDDREPSTGMIHEGELTKHGYHIEEGDERRQEALRKAVSEDGYSETVKRINDLAVVNKGHPSTHARLERDLKYLKDRYRPKADQPHVYEVYQVVPKGGIYKEQLEARTKEDVERMARAKYGDNVKVYPKQYVKYD